MNNTYNNMLTSIPWLMMVVTIISTRVAFAIPPDIETKGFFHGSDWSIFPVPIFKTSPAEGQTYGLMPVVTASGFRGELKIILALAETYNHVTGFSTFNAIYLYPSDVTMFSFFGENAQNFAREATFTVSHLPHGKGAVFLDGKVSYQQYPFERFFGFGPATTEHNETNFVSETVTLRGRVGYRLTDTISTSYGLIIERWLLHDRAITTIADTQTTFAGNPEVVPSTNGIHRADIAYDTHPDPNFSDHGEMLSAAYLISPQALDSEDTFQGYDLRGKFTRGAGQGRFITIVSGLWEQRFGDTVPFYQQSSLGSASTLRAFVERRFTARHRLSVDLEERIELFQAHIAGAAVGFSVDPFVSVGQVFNDVSEITIANLQPIGGFGIRAKVKPAVIGRLDVGFGREGMQLYATLDYPF